MKYKLLGRTGVLVSELCFGTMSFGTETDETEAALMFKACRDAGVNFFDCANNYGGGRAEEILGRLCRECRNDIVITSKVSQRTGKDVNELGASRRHIMQAVERSLARLGTDRIDIYFVHHFDPFTPMDETLRALDDLVRQGKIVYLGVSNWAAWQITKALGISEHKGLARFECIEPMYNLVKRQAEVEILPLAAAEKLGVIVYSPLAAGLLTGKYSQGSQPSAGRILDKKQYTRRYSDPQYFATAEKFAAFAREIGESPAKLALAWANSHPAVTAPIIGARSLEQLKTSLAAADFAMTPELREQISRLSVNPPRATDRLEEDLDEQFLLRNR